MSEKYSFWVTLRPQSDRYCRGEAQACILNFKTTWSESQKVSQTATAQGNAELLSEANLSYVNSILKPHSQSSNSPAERGEAELCIFNFKTLWSEFQKPSPSQTPTDQSEAKLMYTQFQKHMVRVPDANSDCSHRGKAEMRILNFKTTWSEFHHLPRVGPKQLYALAHLGCTHESGTSQ